MVTGVDASALVGAERALARADALAACTETAGELTRTYGSAALVDAGRLVAGWMRDAGMEVRVDAVGNVIGRWTPAGAAGAPVALGSHLDTVRDAGRYDGALGVLVGLAAVELLAARGVHPPFPLEVVAFAEEEGVRFPTSFLGSRVYTGTFDPVALESVDADGTPLAEAVVAMGGDAARLAAGGDGPPELAAYLEVHIEQGPVLEARGLALGVVEGIVGQTRGRVTLTGTPGHAGTVPMAMRHDALCGAAELTLAAERIAAAHEGLVATVGELAVEGGAGNVIPGRVTLSLDLRHHDDAVRTAAVDDLYAAACAIVERRGLNFTWETYEEAAVDCSPRLTAALARALAEAGHEPFALASGAGHDAAVLAEVTEAAMLFVRCRGGISHNPEEAVAVADVAAALEVVAGLLERWDGAPA